MKINKIELMLKESNAIEGEYSVEALIDARAAWTHASGFSQLSKDSILSIHWFLARNLRPDIAGKLRTVDVRVGSRICPRWEKVETLLDVWIDRWSKVRSERFIKQAHIAFEEIHPFEDGNGRVGRIIMLWQTIKNNLPIKIIYEKEKYKYYDWFK